MERPPSIFWARSDSLADDGLGSVAVFKERIVSPEGLWEIQYPSNNFSHIPHAKYMFFSHKILSSMHSPCKSS
jgi:hypothetical protein